MRTRRDLLAALAAALAGCAGGDDAATTASPTPEPTPTAADSPTPTATDSPTPTPSPTASPSPTVTPWNTARVDLQYSSYTPIRLEVDPETTVVWTNYDGYAHDVQSARFHDQAEEWSYYSGTFSEGESVSHRFESEGVYEYYCTIHGKSTMCGAVLVGDVSLDADLPCE